MSLEKIGNIAKQYNPLDNKIDFEDGQLKWKINPRLDNIEKTEFNIVFNKEIVKDKVEVVVEVDGDATIFTRDINDKNLKIKPEIKGKIDIKDKSSGSKIDWNIKPAISVEDPINGLKQTEFDLTWTKDFADKDVKVTVNLNGRASVFTSPPGSRDFRFSFGFSKKLQPANFPLETRKFPALSPQISRLQITYK